MKKQSLIRAGKIFVKALFTLLVLGAVGIPFLMGGLKDPQNPLSHKQVTPLDTMLTNALTTDEQADPERTYTLDDLLSSIGNFVETPPGGLPWDVLGRTGQKPYAYTDAEGMQWSGVHPEFTEDLKKHDGREILIQGYMFPLGQEEKQPVFLLGPFPLSCPYHYHVTPNLIIEVHARTPVAFSYDAVNLRGRLELVPKDDEYNIFYRLRDAVTAR